MTKNTKTTEAVKEAVSAEETAAASKVAASAREFVKRSAATAKERAESLHEGTEKLNTTVENTVHRVVGGYMSFLGGVADATFANVDHALSTVEKLAAAESVTEAVKIQSDFVRENTNANIDRARDAANVVRTAVMDNTSMMREQMNTVWPYGKKAA